MASRRIIYRDYRVGSTGRFVSKEAYNRSKAHGGTSIKREYVTVKAIRTISDLYDLEDYDGDFEPQEYDATGDTGSGTE
jgi:hypothetical protein